MKKERDRVSGVSTYMFTVQWELVGMDQLLVLGRHG